MSRFLRVSCSSKNRTRLNSNTEICFIEEFVPNGFSLIFVWNLTLKISRAFHYHVVDLALSILFLMCEDVKNEFNRRIKVDLRSETYFKKIGNLVFRYNVMLPYRSNRTGKICYDSTSEQQNLNVTILKCLCVLSACRLRSAFMQSIDCLCLCQVLFS